MDDFKRFVGQMPPVTRYYCGISLLLSFCMTYQIVSPYALLLDWEKVIYNFQVWRIFTTFCFLGPFSMSFIFGMMMLYYSVSVIEDYFEQRHADLATLLVFNAIVAMLFAFLANDYLVMESPFIFSLIYVWSKFVPDRQMSIWGFPVQSLYLPWVLMAFHLFTGGNPFNDLIGVAAGHSYVYLTTVLPESHGYELLKTPSIMHKLVAMLKGEEEGRPGNGRMNFLNNDGA